MQLPTFSDQLRAALNSGSRIKHTPSKGQKKNFFKLLEILDEREQQTLLVSRLKQFYRKPARVDQERIKVNIFDVIRNQPYQNGSVFNHHFFSLLPRKMAALGFAFLILIPAFFGPLQLFQSTLVLPSARAAYMQCTGRVFLNNQLCTVGETSPVRTGDSISTSDNSSATIYFNDFTLARLNSATDAIVDNLFRQQVQLLSGGVWLHSQGDIGKTSLKVSTSALKAQVAQGAAGVVVNGSTTQLFTTNSALEVQIDSSSGSTKIVTLAPEKKLTVKKSRNVANVKEAPLDDTQIVWVHDNTVKDQVYLAEIKKKMLNDSLVEAEALPGSVRNFVSRATQSARVAFTWDAQQKFEQNVSSLDALFAETLLLLNKGDKTIAQSNFEAYREKFVSLVNESSGTMSLENAEQLKLSLLEALRKHARLVAPFSSQDPQYVLKDDLQKLALSLDPQILATGDSEKIIDDVSLNRILEAHNSIIVGDIEGAKRLLTETLEIANLATDSLSNSAFSIAILDTISEKSPQLSSIALDIKKKKLDQLRAATPQGQTKEIIGSSIIGTAYKSQSDNEGGTDQYGSTSKVVGQAVKQEDISL